MSWRRLPTFFPNFPLKLIPLTDAQQQLYDKTGSLRQLVFKTLPSVNKVRPSLALARAAPLSAGTAPCDGQP